LIRVHSRMIREFGGEDGILSEGAIENCIALPMLSVFGTETAPTIWSKAATLLHCIATRHPFVDGNKRTAWAAAKVFLLLNGFRLSAGVDGAEGIVLSVVKGETDLEALAEWIKDRSSKELL
jgi:death-on-curing protein